MLNLSLPTSRSGSWILYRRVGGLTNSSGTPLTFTSPVPFLQKATAVAVFFLPNTCREFCAMFLQEMQGRRILRSLVQIRFEGPIFVLPNNQHSHTKSTCRSDNISNLTRTELSPHGWGQQRYRSSLECKLSTVIERYLECVCKERVENSMRERLYDIIGREHMAP